MSNNVVNLWVKRQERKRELDARGIVWACSCGCQEFHYYMVSGMVCVDCGKRIVTPKR